jgi:hypothetical protein
VNWQTPEPVPRRPKPDKSTGPKIIVQYRAKRGKVYELQCIGAVVCVAISKDDPDAEPATWRVGASSPSIDALPSVEARGVSAAEALAEVARAWKAHTPALTAFDWDAIAHELHVVQAL